ncbi:DinB family protein [Megalodesulfovibrio paquesii]
MMLDMDLARAAVADMQALLDATPPQAGQLRLGPDVWTLGEILGHLIDSACNNHQRFARLRFGDLDQFPGYDAEPWVQAQDYASCDFRTLCALWTSYNALLLHLAATIPDHARANAWRTPDGPLTLDFLTQDYYAHLRRHIDHYAARLAEVQAALAG